MIKEVRSGEREKDSVGDEAHARESVSSECVLETAPSLPETRCRGTRSRCALRIDDAVRWSTPMTKPPRGETEAARSGFRGVPIGPARSATNVPASGFGRSPFCANLPHRPTTPLFDTERDGRRVSSHTAWARRSG